MKRITLIADDYGLAPGVSDAIRELIARGRLSGTSCMTVFDDWGAEASLLAPLLGEALAGLHVTLTDQPALAGRSTLAADGRLPALPRLVASLASKRIGRRDVEAELDAQLGRFREGFGRDPDFVDGHQHVHFLPCVRDWLAARFAHAHVKPRLRGAPRLAAGAALKIATIAALARGFDPAMGRAGFVLMTPLAGIYDWRRPADFAATVEGAVRDLPADGVFMCHPGRVDDILRHRDSMIEARETELAFLGSDQFASLLAAADASVARRAA